MEVAEDFPIRPVETEKPFEVEMEEGSGIDWLELHPGMTVDGQRIDLARPLVGLLADKADAALIGGEDDDTLRAPVDKPFGPARPSATRIAGSQTRMQASALDGAHAPQHAAIPPLRRGIAAR